MRPKFMVYFGAIMMTSPIWLLILISGFRWRSFVYNYNEWTSYFSEFYNIFPSECDMALFESQNTSQMLETICDMTDTLVNKPHLTVIYSISLIGGGMVLLGLYRIFMPSVKKVRHEK